MLKGILDFNKNMLKVRIDVFIYVYKYIYMNLYESYRSNCAINLSNVWKHPVV